MYIVAYLSLNFVEAEAKSKTSPPLALRGAFVTNL